MRIFLSIAIVLLVNIVDAQDNRGPYVQQLPFVNAMTFGVSGTSVADQSTLVQNAINSLPAGGGIVQVPAGTILVKGLSLPTGVTLQCQSISAGVGATTGATIIKLPNGANTFIAASASYITNTNANDSFVGFKGCVFEGNATNQSGSSSLIYLRSFRSVFEGNVVRNSVGAGLTITVDSANATATTGSMAENRVAGNQFLANAGAGVFGVDDGNKLADGKIIDNIFAANGSDATHCEIDIARGAGFLITHNWTYNVGLCDLNILGAGNVNINGNRFDGPNTSPSGAIVQVAVTTSGFGDGVIVGNTFRQAASALAPGTSWTMLSVTENASSTSGISITGNAFQAPNFAVTSIVYSGSGKTTVLNAQGNVFSPNSPPPSFIITAPITASVPTSDNLLINGDFAIDQYNEGASVTPTTAAMLTDRWRQNQGVASKLSYQRVSAAPAPAGNFSMLITTLVQTAPTAAQTWGLIQRVEGINMAHLGWGTSTAQSVVLSYDVKSSLTGDFSYSLKNNSANRSYVGVCTIAAANTWQRCVSYIPGDTTGTWLITTNSNGLNLTFDLGSGTNLQTSTLNAWQAGNFVEETGGIQLVNNVAATINIANVRLYIGNADTQYIPRQYAAEFALAMRHYRKSFPSGTAPIQNGAVAGSSCVKNPIALGDPSLYVAFNPPMMASPTITTYNPSAANANWRDVTASADVTVSVDPATAVGSTGVLVATSGTVATLGDILCIHYTAQSEL